MHTRLAECEVVASNALTAAKEALDVLKRQPPRGDTGATGPKGDSIVGPAGRDGKNGKDGRDAVGINGTNGRDGKDGKDGAPGPDSAVVLAETRAELANVLKQFEDLKLVVTAIQQQNAQSKEYIEYLRNKVRSK